MAQIRRLTDSCLLVTTDAGISLFDPGFHTFGSGEIDLDSIGDVTRVFISHEHRDHVDPGFNTDKWGDGAYLFPDPSSSRYGNGHDGSNLGADIRFQFINGVETTQPLWPWPMP